MRTGAVKANFPLFGKADTADKFDPAATSVILEGDSEQTLRTIPPVCLRLTAVFLASRLQAGDTDKPSHWRRQHIRRQHPSAHLPARAEFHFREQRQ